MNLAFVYVAKGLEVSFKVVSKVPANATVGWDFGVNGSSSEVLNPTFTYENPGYYTVTLTVTEPPEEGGEPIISTVSQVVMVTDSGTKTHLNDSIYNLIDLYIPTNLVSEGMSLQQKTTYIQKWQLYIGPLVDHEIPIEEFTNELQYEGLENQLIMELAVWDFLNVQITSLLTGTGQYIDSLTYQSKSSDSDGDGSEDSGDEEGKTGRVKRIQTGPTEVEYFDDLSDSLSTLYKAYTQALQPGGIMDILRQNLCNLASRLMIFLPFCDNSYKPVKVPRVVNRRHPHGIDGPNPPTLLTHK
jgi:PKD repeat protein